MKPLPTPYDITSIPYMPMDASQALIYLLATTILLVAIYFALRRVTKKHSKNSSKQNLTSKIDKCLQIAKSDAITKSDIDYLVEMAKTFLNSIISKTHLPDEVLLDLNLESASLKEIELTITHLQRTQPDSTFLEALGYLVQIDRQRFSHDFNPEQSRESLSALYRQLDRLARGVK